MTFRDVPVNGACLLNRHEGDTTIVRGFHAELKVKVTPVPELAVRQNNAFCASSPTGIESADGVQNGGSRVGCHCESATLCNQHQARMSKQADAPVSMRPCLAGRGRGWCSS